MLVGQLALTVAAVFMKRQTDAELIMKRLARMPTGEDIWRAVLIGMLGGACLTQLLALAFR
jgi:hypothetical protein